MFAVLAGGMMLPAEEGAADAVRNDVQQGVTSRAMSSVRGRVIAWAWRGQV